MTKRIDPEQVGEGAELPRVIAHRGASAHRPEHTLAAYELGIDQGADAIEADLVATRDGELVARHENDISRTTDVGARPEFAERRTTKVIDGVAMTGWFSEDFTLAELRTLRATERLPRLRPANCAFDGQDPVPTLQEVLDLARRRGVRVYLELKHSTYFASLGLGLEAPLVEVLEHNGYRARDASVVIQSFETGDLRRLRTMTRLPLAQLVGGTGRPYDLEAAGDERTYRDLATPTGLAEIATYADGIGPNKNLAVPRDAEGRLTEPSRLVEDAHRAGLFVNVYTFRSERPFLPVDLQGDPAAEIRAFLAAGVDGVIADDPDLAVDARDELLGAAA